MKALPCFAVLAGLGVAVPAPAQDATQTAKEEIRDYTAVGRVKWQLPAGPDFGCGFKVPHFTQGARVGCSSREGGATTEISVYSRDLQIDPALRRARFESELEKMLSEAKEASYTVKTHGPWPAIVYATLTHKNRKENPRATIGYYSKGPFLIRFVHESSDASDRELERVLPVILSAEPVDALAFLAWKLSDYKAICESLFPAGKQANDAAFAGSMFANVDWLRLMQERNKDADPEKIAQSARKAKENLANEMAGGKLEERAAFCRAYPGMTLEAERGLPSGRRRGVVGIVVQEVTPERARLSGLPSKTGADVHWVARNGPAWRAGIRPGDLIVRAGGEEISSSVDVARIVGSVPAASKLDITVLRGAERLTLPVTSADAPD